MEIKSLGHVVLKVRDRARAEAFYNGVLGLPIAARYDKLDMTFFTLGNHHDFAVMAMGDEAVLADRRGVGLLHVAFNLGTDIELLRKAKADLEAAGVKVRAVDHEVTQSLYFTDPDGNGLEVYVDTSDVWKTNPGVIAQGEPFDL